MAGSNLIDLVKERALIRSAEFIEARGTRALLFGRKEKLWDYVSNQIPEQGMMLEFGVWRGKSINHMASLHPDRTILGFDSFEGLSEDWSGSNHSAGHFDLGGQLPDVRSNVALTKGWVEDTLPPFLAETPGTIAYLHVDTDTYSPARTILSLAGHRLTSGSIVLFDQLLGYPNWEHGEYRALTELWPEESYEIIAFSQMQAAIRMFHQPLRE